MKTNKSLHWVKKKPMSKVNLDALIPREDLFIVGDNNTEYQKPDYLVLRIDADLNPTKSWFIKAVRKPDFQRETSEWKPERVAGLIRSFIRGDIIPAIILWHWKGTNFVIDGGHRLSALVAWISNDYGDGALSKTFFGYENITKEQRRNAEKTRKLIDNDGEIGPFSTYQYAFDNPEKVSQEALQKARVLSNKTLQLQWIHAKTSEDAEQSFFRINGEATPINDTEALILKSRDKPNGISSRAIVHSGSAHKYWGKFKNNQTEIENIAEKVNRLLFHPELEPEKNRFPIGGTGYSNQTLELVFGIVNIINGLDELNTKRSTFLKKPSNEIPPESDVDGLETIKYLNKVERIIGIISGSEGYSLGLSPLIYFYNNRGRFQITAFFSMVYIITKWESLRRSRTGSNDVFQRFCAVRGDFEEFLYKHKNLISQTQTNVGSGVKSYKRLAELFEYIIEEFQNRRSSEQVLALIKNDERFSFIKVTEAENEYEANRNKPGKKFPKETKTQILIKTYLEPRILCPICGGHATFESYNIDHITAIRDGGNGSVDNGKLGHVYCNEERETIREIINKST